MKRIILILAAVMMISSCACRKESSKSAETATEMENIINAEPEFDIITTHGTMRVKL